MPRLVIQILLFKEYPDRRIVVLQGFHPPDTVHKVSGKARDGFRNDHVNFPVHGVFHKLLKALPVCRIGAGKAVIHVATGVFPIGILLDPLHVLLDLQMDRQLLINVIC